MHGTKNILSRSNTLQPMSHLDIRQPLQPPLEFVNMQLWSAIQGEHITLYCKISIKIRIQSDKKLIKCLNLLCRDDRVLSMSLRDSMKILQHSILYCFFGTSQKRISLKLLPYPNPNPYQRSQYRMLSANLTISCIYIKIRVSMIKKLMLFLIFL